MTPTKWSGRHPAGATSTMRAAALCRMTEQKAGEIVDREARGRRRRSDGIALAGGGGAKVGR
jgi:hypothetical protein